MKKRYKHNGEYLDIDFDLTGEVVDRVSEYDYSEIVEGIDQHGQNWVGEATLSAGEIIDITCIEKEG